jgi:hypothetical protein
MSASLTVPVVEVESFLARLAGGSSVSALAAKSAVMAGSDILDFFPAVPSAGILSEMVGNLEGVVVLAPIILDGPVLDDAVSSEVACFCNPGECFLTCCWKFSNG